MGGEKYAIFLALRADRQEALSAAARQGNATQIHSMLVSALEKLFVDYYTKSPVGGRLHELPQKTQKSSANRTVAGSAGSGR